MPGDRHEKLRKAIEDATLRGEGETPRELRQALSENRDIPEELRALVDKIRRAPHKVTDEDIDALRSRYSEDQIFEVVVAASLGASTDRVRAGLRALEEA